MSYKSTGYEEFFVRKANGQTEMLCFGPEEEKPEAGSSDVAIESRSLMVARYGIDGYQKS
jgi:hypothetical protein